MEERDSSDGVLIVDASNAIVFRCGIATQKEVETAVLKHALPPTVRSMNAFSIGDRQFVALVRKSSTHHAYLIHELSEEDTLFDFISTVDFAYSIFQHFVCSPFEAMAVIDAESHLRYISPVHQKSLGLAYGEGIGRPVTEVIKNTGLPSVIRSRKSKVGEVMDINGRSRIVSRIPIFKEGEVVGAIGQMMFKGPEQLHDLSREVARLKSEVSFYQRELSVMRSRSYGLEQILGNGDAIRELKSQIVRIAPLDVPVLLLGESGTGKELAAHAIHNLSNRKDRGMVAINAGAIPPTLVESEMFGYEAGAFTGAERKGRKGKIELADKGTLFLDEIGDTPADMQIKLLRVFQDGMFERVGGDRPRHSDFRLITATNRDLKTLTDENKFRLDLFYRISSITIRLPALRERLEDIPVLVDTFLQAYCRRHHLRNMRVHKDVYPYLKELPWPGNVRQLLHEVEKAAIFCDADEITAQDFSKLIEKTSETSARSGAPVETGPTTLEGAEIGVIREALIRHRGNKSRVADELRISRSYLYKKLALMSASQDKTS